MKSKGVVDKFYAVNLAMGNAILLRICEAILSLI